MWLCSSCTCRRCSVEEMQDGHRITACLLQEEDRLQSALAGAVAAAGGLLVQVLLVLSVGT